MAYVDITLENCQYHKNQGDAMPATIVWTQKARRQLLRIAHKDRGRVYEAAQGLRDWPLTRNVKALKGRDGHRLRVGRYRVLFQVEQGIPVIVVIEEVKKRDERTY